jgi:hypothetical protein
MLFFQNILRMMDRQMKTPQLFGWFHIVSLTLTVLVTMALCFRHKEDSPNRVRAVVFGTAVLVALAEIYKQINYSFSYTNGIVFDYQWYAFPFQFCSTPMYVGLLAGVLKKGKLQDALYAYLATFAVFAGVSVMIYPGDVFVGTLGINIQTVICHGSMICIGVYLLYTGTVKLEHRTIIKAMTVFACTVSMAVLFNEIAYWSGLLERETFNMFFISPHCKPSLPVYSLVQAVVPYPWCLLIYILGFTMASYLILLIAMGVQWLSLVNVRKVGIKV